MGKGTEIKGKEGRRRIRQKEDGLFMIFIPNRRFTDSPISYFPYLASAAQGSSFVGEQLSVLASQSPPPLVSHMETRGWECQGEGDPDQPQWWADTEQVQAVQGQGRYDRGCMEGLGHQPLVRTVS